MCFFLTTPGSHAKILEVSKMFINHTLKQVTAKIVYYGPGLSGKTTNLQYIFSVTNPRNRGELVSVETEIERTLFFDLLPINVGQIKGYESKFQLYTVPGQIFYDSTRKMVLKGADGIVFVVDSQQMMEEANIESFQNLKTNLLEQNQHIKDIPLVFQFNKRDLNNISSVTRLSSILNKLEKPYFEAIAIEGQGVINTLREISSQTINKIKVTLEHIELKEIKSFSVKFDTDPKYEIKDKDKIPQQKISMEKIESKTAGDTAKKEIEENKNTNPTETDKKEAKKEQVPEKKGSFKPDEAFSLLDQFKDKSRITVLKKVNIKNNKLKIDLKDHNNKGLDSFEVKTNPETKKITIIIDVKQ